MDADVDVDGTNDDGCLEEPEVDPGSLRPATVIGVFIGVFGVAVLVAIAFTPETRGQIVNLACGLTLLVSAGLFIQGGVRAAKEAARRGGEAA